MHTYSINSEERKTVIFLLALISTALVLIAKYQLYLPHWLPVPSVFAVFGGLFWIFDKYAWRWSWINAGISTPNLNGEWIIYLKSSLDEFKNEYEGKLTITQTWTKIHLYLDGEKFTGVSKMAGIEVHTSTSFTLKWEYLSKRKPEFVKDNEYMHYGITNVTNEPGNLIKKLEGDYYADRSRHSSGPVRIIKKA
jgi:hypothetical protein